MTVEDSGAGSYGLRRPTMADANQAMHRVHSYTGRSHWARLLAASGLTGNETDEPALLRLLEAMSRLDPVSRMCAQALGIRLAAHTHLSAAHTITRSPA
jgi:hypothetical protein